MVNPSDPDATPRRDGYLERRGTWGEVTVGSLLAGPKRTDVLEVIDTRAATQIATGYTLWFRVNNIAICEAHTIEPRLKSDPVTFLMKDDDARPPERTPVADAAEIALLVEHLGARHIATLDVATGEVHAPDYASGARHSPETGGQRPGISSIDELEHLEVMHGLDISGLRDLTGNDRLVAISRAHGPLHGPKASGMPHGGVPHRHVPEDLTYF